MTSLSTEIISFDDAGAEDDHPVKGITMGHIRRWFDRVEQLHVALEAVDSEMMLAGHVKDVVDFALASHTSKTNDALQALADIDRDLIGHDETMANLDALTIRRP